MHNTPEHKVNLERLAWGALLLWWGIRWLSGNWPNGIGLVGTGAILLGLNAARSLRGIPTRGSTTGLGLLALAAGGLILSASVLGWTLELPLLELALILLGGLMIVRELLRSRKSTLAA